MTTSTMKNPRPVSQLSLPPGPKNIVSNLIRRVTNCPKMSCELHRDYGDIVFFRMPAKLCIVYSPELVEELWVKRAKEFETIQFDKQSSVIKHGCMQLTRGAEHRRRRAVMDPGFAPQTLDRCASIMTEEAAALRERCRSATTVDMKMEAGTFAWAVMARTMVGRDVTFPYFKGRDIVSLTRIHILIGLFPFTKLWEKLPFPVFTKGKRAIAEMDEWIYQSIERAKDPHYQGDNLITFLMRAVDNGVADWTFESDEALRDEILVMHCFVDAPVAGLVFAMSYLSKNPRVREKLEREVDEVLGGRDMTLSDYPQLVYTQAVIKEMLRMDPPAYLTLPKVVEADGELGGYRIPKGTLVHVGVKALHRDARYWDDPLEFKPERWLEEPSPPSVPYTYVPYAAGPHDCMGAEFSSRMLAFGLVSVTQQLRLDLLSEEFPQSTNVGAAIANATVPMKVAKRTGV